MIYFVQRANGDIKIGKTSNISQRLSQLQTEHGKLHLLGWVEGDIPEEREVQRRFRRHRTELEWFYAHSELLDFIEANANKEAPKVQWVTICLDENMVALIGSLHKMQSGLNQKSPTLAQVIEGMLRAQCPELERNMQEYELLFEELRDKYTKKTERDIAKRLGGGNGGK